jgi:hypothetical protein
MVTSLTRKYQACRSAGHSLGTFDLLLKPFVTDQQFIILWASPRFREKRFREVLKNQNVDYKM